MSLTEEWVLKTYIYKILKLDTEQIIINLWLYLESEMSLHSLFHFPVLRMQVHQAVVVQAFISSTREAEAGRSLWVQGQHSLHRLVFLDNQGYEERPCNNNNNNNTQLSQTSKMQGSFKHGSVHL